MKDDFENARDIKQAVEKIVEVRNKESITKEEVVLIIMSFTNGIMKYVEKAIQEKENEVIGSFERSEGSE